MGFYADKIFPWVLDELDHVPPFSGMNLLYTHIRGIATKQI